MKPVLVAVPDVGGVGLGHFIRTVALSQAWNRRAGRSFIVAPPLAEPLEALLARESIAHLCAEGSDAVVAAVHDVAREQSITAIAVDGYRFGASLERALTPSAAAMLAFDDGGETGAHEVDLLTDPTAGIDPSVYRDGASGARLLLGPRYAALRREFGPSDDAAVPVASGPIVLLAGGDPQPTVRSWFASVAERLRATGLDVVAPGITEPWVGDVAPLLGTAVVAVAAGGSSALELCRLGVPSLLVVVAPNQAAPAGGIAAAGAAKLLGPIEAVDPETVAPVIAELVADAPARAAMARAGRELVDGRGADRLVVALRAAALRVEAAEPDDSERLWEWVNDPETRAASFGAGPRSRADHDGWFTGQLANPTARIYLASLPGTSPFGLVRFEQSHGERMIGVNIASEARGSGFGAALIVAGVDRVCRDLGPEPVVAFVKPDNARSQRAFLDAGFGFDGSRVGPRGSLRMIREGRAE